MDIVQYDDKTSFIFGLNWTPLDSALKKNVQIKEFLKQGYNQKIVLKNDDTVTYGLAVSDDFYKKNKTKKYSAAAAIANIPRFVGSTTLIVMEEEGDAGNVVALIGLIKGNIVLDCLVSVSRFSEYYENYRSRCFRANVNERIFGSLITLSLNLAGDFAWSNLIPDKKSDDHPPKTYQLSGLRTDFVFYALGALLMAAFVAYSAWFAWSWWEESIAAREMRRQALLNSPEAKYQKAITQIIGGKQFKATEVLGSVASQLGAFPVNFAGFTLEKMACSADSIKPLFLCNVTWKSAGGTYADFASAAPKEWTNILSTNVIDLKDEVSVSHTPKLGSSADKNYPDYRRVTHDYILQIPKEKLADRKNWLKDTDVYLKANELDVSLASLGWKPTFSAAQVQGLPSGMSQEQANKIASAIYGISFSLKGAPYWMTDVVPKISSELVLNNFLLQFSGLAVTFSTTGVIYVNKNN